MLEFPDHGNHETGAPLINFTLFCYMVSRIVGQIKF